MPQERFYIDESLENGSEIVLSGDEAHHVTRVMRGKVGDSIELINGKGILAQAIIQNMQKEKVCCRIEKATLSSKKSPLILAQAIPRFNRLEYIIEKATELNVEEFWLFPGKQSEKSDFSANQQERMRTLMIAAMKQSGRLTLPQILFKPSLFSWGKPEGTFLFGDTDPKAPYLWNALTSPLVTPIIFAVGPESGFHKDEVHYLKNTLFGKGVKLHDNILRVDTAPLTALSLLQQFC